MPWLLVTGIASPLFPSTCKSAILQPLLLVSVIIPSATLEGLNIPFQYSGIAISSDAYIIFSDINLCGNIVSAI